MSPAARSRMVISMVVAGCPFYVLNRLRQRMPKSVPGRFAQEGIFYKTLVIRNLLPMFLKIASFENTKPFRFGRVGFHFGRGWVFRLVSCADAAIFGWIGVTSGLKGAPIHGLCLIRRDKLAKRNKNEQPD